MTSIKASSQFYKPTVTLQPSYGLKLEVVPTPTAGAQDKNLQRSLSNDGDTFTAVQSMEGCNYAGVMEVQLGADATTILGLVLLVWWIMPLSGKVPHNSWCGLCG